MYREGYGGLNKAYQGCLSSKRARRSINNTRDEMPHEPNIWGGYERCGSLSWLRLL
jgi:hypothetical protein